MPPTPHTAGIRPDDTIDFGLSLARLLADAAEGDPAVPAASAAPATPAAEAAVDFKPADTPAGTFRLVPVDLGRDLRLVHGWMNDPEVAAFWQLAGDEAGVARHLRAQLEGPGHSVPCLGVLDGTPMSYWEIYRADLDPLAQSYAARPHDTGIHLLIGGAADRGRGLGSLLLRTVGELVLGHRDRCERVIAEPDVRNVASVAAFLNAGFHLQAEVDLPDKRAALMVLERALRGTGPATAPPRPPDRP